MGIFQPAMLVYQKVVASTVFWDKPQRMRNSLCPKALAAATEEIKAGTKQIEPKEEKVPRVFLGGVFLFSPRNLGELIQFDLRIFFRWVETSHPFFMLKKMILCHETLMACMTLVNSPKSITIETLKEAAKVAICLHSQIGLRLRSCAQLASLFGSLQIALVSGGGG